MGHPDGFGVGQPTCSADFGEFSRFSRTWLRCGRACPRRRACRRWRAERLEEHDGEDLAVGEALNPDVAEQPCVAAAGRMPALQREGQRGGDEVDDEEGKEEGQQLLEAGRRGGLGMEVFVVE